MKHKRIWISTKHALSLALPFLVVENADQANDIYIPFFELSKRIIGKGNNQQQEGGQRNVSKNLLL
jgi:hypothetical protein